MPPPTPDPHKPGVGGGNPGGKQKVEVPRDAEGNPSKWVEGMALCKCGIGGGRHLFKECPKAKDKKAKEAAKKALAAQKKAAAERALAAEGAVPGPSDEQVRAALAAYLSSMMAPPAAFGLSAEGSVADAQSV